MVQDRSKITMDILGRFQNIFGKKEARQLDKNYSYWDDQDVDMLHLRVADLKKQIEVADSSDSYENKVKAVNKHNEIDYITKVIKIKGMETRVAMLEQREASNEDAQEVENKEVTEEPTKKEAFLKTGDTVMITLQRGDPDYKKNGKVAKISSINNLPGGSRYKVDGVWWCESSIRAHDEDTTNWTEEEEYKSKLTSNKRNANLNNNQLKEYVLLDIWNARYNPFLDEVSNISAEGLTRLANKIKVYGLTAKGSMDFVKEANQYFTDNFEELKESKSLFQTEDVGRWEG